MSLYKKQIEQLVALQQVDHEIFDIKGEIRKLPEEVAEMEKTFSVIEAERIKIVDKMEYLTSQEKRVNTDMEEDARHIDDSKNKMMQVENTREYHAMIREVDNMERANRTREEEKMILMEEIQRQQDMFADVDGRYNEIKQEYDAKNASLEEKLDELNRKLGSLMEHRSASAKEVPPPVLARYEFIRERLKNPVIVPVVSSVCLGCNISIPPQTFIELQKIQQILSCPNCQRLIYWKEHFDPTDTVDLKKEALGKHSSAAEDLEDDALEAVGEDN